MSDEEYLIDLVKFDIEYRENAISRAGDVTHMPTDEFIKFHEEKLETATRVLKTLKEKQWKKN
jgi:hypothetical protein